MIICQVSDWEREEIQYLRELGLVPGTTVTVSTVAPFDGPLTLEVEEKTVALARPIAEKIGVVRDQG